MRATWLNDWDEARQHPWRVRVLTLVSFALLGAGFAWHAHLHFPWPAVALVAGTGAIGLTICEKTMKEALTQSPQERIIAGRLARKRFVQWAGGLAALLGAIYAITAFSHSLWGVLTVIALYVCARVAVRARRK